MTIVLDDWQKDFLNKEGDKMLCTGRQVGKSVVCSIDAAKYALNNPKKHILIIAPTERQSFELFDKTLNYLMNNARHEIRRGKDRPTKHQIKLKNGSKISCYPTGTTGLGIRGLTVHRLYVDEASRVPEEVWSAVTPMLLTTGGSLIMISTPMGRRGYFFQEWNNEDSKFHKFSITSETVIKNRPIRGDWTELIREKALEKIKSEKKRMSKIEFAQEYLGYFMDELGQFFPDKLIHKCMTQERPTSIKKGALYYLGVDIARMGEDESTFEIVRKSNNKLLIHVESIITTKTQLTDTFHQIKQLNKLYNFKRIFIDDEGIGIGVFDMLLDDDETKRKTVGINNSRRVIDREGNRQKKLLKEDLYNNLRAMMENGEILLLDDSDVFQSLKSVQYEYITGTKGHPQLKITGSYTHIAEGLIRCAWCKKYKDLNIWIDSFKV